MNIFSVSLSSLFRLVGMARRLGDPTRELRLDGRVSLSRVPLMALGDLVTIKDLKKEADSQIEFEELMVEAYDKPWWRRIVAAVKQRQQHFVAQLVAAQEDQRTEDRVRGQINECDFFLTLDEQARLAQEIKNGSRK